MAINVAVTLRSLLTRALSWAELDNNFTAIKTALAGATSDADLASTASGDGAGIPGFDWAVVPPAANKSDWGIQTARQGVNVLRYIPPAEWAAILSGTSTTDVSSYIQSAWNANKQVYHPAGTYCIGAPLNLPSQRFLTGDGISTIFKALPSLAGATKPVITAGSYSPVLDKVPMISNATPIQWYSLKGIYLDGNSQDIIGLWLHENFYGDIQDFYILNTLSRPYTNIRGQGVVHTNFVCYGCTAGVVLYDNTNMKFIGGGFERLAASWYVDQRQPNPFSKGGVTFEEVWFESDATHRPSNGFLKLSGRRNRASIHCAFDTAATSEQSISFSDTADSRTVDGLTMTNANCVGADVLLNVATGGMFMIAAAGSAYNKVRGFFTVGNVTDNGTANQWNVNASLASPVEHVNTRWQVRAPLSITASDYVLDAQWNAGSPILYMLKSTTKYFDLNGANWRMTSGAGLDFVANAGASAINYTASAYVFNGSSGASGYTKPVYLGTYALWVDSTGKLRIKSSAPTSDADGAVVGTQT